MYDILCVRFGSYKLCYGVAWRAVINQFRVTATCSMFGKQNPQSKRLTVTRKLNMYLLLAPLLDYIKAM